MNSNKTTVQSNGIKSDGFTQTVNPEAIHDYAVNNNMEHLSYALVRACYIRDSKGSANYRMSN